MVAKENVEQKNFFEDLLKVFKDKERDAYTRGAVTDPNPRPEEDPERNLDSSSPDFAKKKALADKAAENNKAFQNITDQHNKNTQEIKNDFKTEKEGDDDEREGLAHEAEDENKR